MSENPVEADEHVSQFVGAALRALYWPIAQEPLPFRYGRALGSLFIATTAISALPRGVQRDWRRPAPDLTTPPGGEAAG